MEYKTIIVRLNASDRPPLPEGKISKRARGEYIRGQQEWFKQATEPVRDKARDIGCTALSQLWHSGELMIAVPNDGFDVKVEVLQNIPGIVGYEVYEPREIEPTFE